MIRAVLDANIIVSGFPASSGTLAALIEHWRAGQFRIVVSYHIMREVERAWSKPYWQPRFAPPLVERALAVLQIEGEVTPLTVPVEGVATHPEDDKVLATAISGRADYLVTGDWQLQRLGSYRGVGILSPRQFLALLEDEDIVNRG